MKVLVLGMGNPILSDDGVGLLIAERLRERLPGVDVAASAMIGVGLLDQIIGYDQIFVIDAMIAPNGELGSLKKIFPAGTDGTLHLFSSHGVGFFELMELGKLLGYAMPAVGGIYGIGINSPVAFGETLSRELSEKIPKLTDSIFADILSGISPDSVTSQ